MSDFNEEEPKEIFSCHIALAVTPDFFAKQQSKTKGDLHPAFYHLINECNGKITESGIYAIRLQIEKLK